MYTVLCEIFRLPINQVYCKFTRNSSGSLCYLVAHGRDTPGSTSTIASDVVIRML